MNLRAIFLALVLAVLSTALQAQPPDSLWSRTFGGFGEERSWSVRQTVDGGFVLGGYTSSFGAGGYDFWLLKTDGSGDSVWSRTFGGSGDDYCYSVQQTTDNGCVLGGYTDSFGAGGKDFWLVKTDNNGDSLWSHTFGGSLNERGQSVLQTNDDGYALAGYANSFGVGGPDFWLVKTNADGDSVWSRTFGGTGNDYCLSARQTSDGGYILAGYSNSYGAGGYDFWLVKTDVVGDSMWSRTFGGSNDEYCQTLQQTADGGYALAGATFSFGAGTEDIWLVKTDANGDSLWSRTFGGLDEEYCYSIVQTGEGGYVLGGHTFSFGAGMADFWLIRTNSNGDSLWSRTFGGYGNDAFRSVQQTVDEGFVVAGFSSSSGAGVHDFWLVKTGPEVFVPQNLVIYVDNGQIVLRWAENNNPFYRVYSDDNAEMSSPSLLGSTTDTEFAVADLSEEERFFFVVGSDLP